MGNGSPTVIVASGGFSFDWGLIQPKIAQITRICTYDPAGVAWSDPDPSAATPTCNNRVTELHALLNSAGVAPPYVLAGYSIGGLVARLYAARYSAEVSGMVLVDHAFIDTPRPLDGHSQPNTFSGVDSPPVLISKAPIALDLEDDDNFKRLPERDQHLHRWALSIGSFRPSPEMAAECFGEVADAEPHRPFPLGDKPLAVVSTLYDSPQYVRLQEQLLALSHDSRQFVARNSTHMVVIDEPETVIQAIAAVVQSAKSGTHLRTVTAR